MGRERMAGASGQDARPVASGVLGPVLSRGLGRSLGVELVPYKVCLCGCVFIAATRDEREKERP
jgi:wyosine [tRNA(Phe)-imidazoG37] synthetase (radical SAM superfamily)